MNRQHKSLSKGLIEDLDSKGRVKHAINAFNVLDSDDDISEPGSFDKTIKENFNRVKWFLNHNTGILLGVPLELKADDRYLMATSQFNMAKEISRDTYEDYKLYAENGKSLEHSFGFDVIKRNQKDNRRISEYRLWEYSTLTNWGANEHTPLVDLKSLDSPTITQSIEWLELCCRKGNYTDAKGKLLEAKIKELKSLFELDQPTDVTEEKQQPTIEIKQASFDEAIKNLKITL